MNLLINDTDEDNDSLFIDSFEGPYSGILEKNKERIQYIPNNEFYGVDSFRYKISDGKDLSNSSLVTLNVIKEVNVLFEAEKFKKEIDYNPFIIEYDEDASGGSYVTTPTELKSSWNDIPDEGCLAFMLNLESDSNLDIWVKVKNERAGFWVIIDDKDPVECYFYCTPSVWEWKNIGLIFDLTKGKHQLKIKRRRSGTNLDMIFVTNIEQSAKEIEDVVESLKSNEDSKVKL